MHIVEIEPGRRVVLMMEPEEKPEPRQRRQRADPLIPARLVVQMYRDGLSPMQIAQVTGLKEHAVRQRLHRAALKSSDRGVTTLEWWQEEIKRIKSRGMI